MPTVMDAKPVDGKMVTTRYVQVPLVSWYLGRAAHFAQRAQRTLPAPGPTRDPVREEVFEAAFLTIIFSALALEAGANAFAEDVYRRDQLPAFTRCRRAFAVPAGVTVSRCVWKWKLLFAERGSPLGIADEPLAGAEALIQARHKFEHYKPTEFAYKAVYEKPLPKIVPGQAEASFELWSASDTPTRIEPSVVEQEVNPSSAKRHYLAARAVFARWLTATGDDVRLMEKVAPVM